MEIEVKLQLDAAALRKARQWIRRSGVAHQRLRAQYFDTTNRHLAAEAIALRLRFERGKWVQTLKAATSGSIARFEHEVTVQRGRPDRAPALEPSLHQHTDIGPRLALALSSPEAGLLQPLFETDVRRTTARVRSRRGCVEVSLDVGSISAPRRRSLRVCEIEVELIKGSPRAVIDVAQHIMRVLPAWPDSTSKAERGHRLASGLTSAPSKAALARQARSFPRLSKRLFAYGR
jgi:triphosphatase